MRRIQICPLKPSSVTFSDNDNQLNAAHYGNITSFFDFVTTSINSCLKKLEDLRIQKGAEECAESKSVR